MAMKSPRIKIYVTALLIMHGSVRPTHTHKPIKRKKKEQEQEQDVLYYELTSTELPKGTSLIAPKILGKAYFENRESTDSLIRSLIKHWTKNGSFVHEHFSDLFLSKLNGFEQTDVASMKELLHRNDDVNAHLFKLKHPYLTQKYKADKKYRLNIENAAAEKLDIEWDSKHSFITEKSYAITPSDKTPNCIMFFCENLTIPSFRPSSWPMRDVEISNLFSIPILYVDVDYDDTSRLFKITFPSLRSVTRFRFQDLDLIVRTVLDRVARLASDASASADKLDFRIKFFDFTCHETIFPQDDHRLNGLTPQLLSSRLLPGHDAGAELTYGTTPTGVLKHEDDQRERTYGVGVRPGDSPSDAEGISPVSTHDGSSSVESSSIGSDLERPVRWPSSSSQSKPSTTALIVHVDRGVSSFVNFKPFVPQSLSLSLSPAHTPRASPVLTSLKRPRSASSHSPKIGGRTRAVRRVYRKRFTVRRRAQWGKRRTIHAH